MDYPSNSNRAKAETIKPKREKIEEAKEKEAIQEEKIVTQVTTSKVIRRKKPLHSRVTDLLGTPDFNSVADQITKEVLIPSAKEMVEEAFGQGISRILWGEDRAHISRKASRNGSGRVNYSGAFSNSTRPSIRDEVPTVRRKTADYEEIILATRIEAEDVMDRMYDLLEAYDVVSVQDLYQLVGIVGNHQDQKWGWFSLKGLQARRIKGGYLLDVPAPEFLD